MGHARRTILGLLLVLGYLVTGGPSRALAVCGDLNCDGHLTIADCVRLQRAILVPNPADCCGLGSASCGDLNPSSPGLELSDVVACLNFLGGGNCSLFGLCQGPGPDICVPNPGSGPGGESWTTRATVTGNISMNQRWTAGCRVDVDGLTFVQPGVTLTIEPGALVVGKNPPTSGLGGAVGTSALVFLRGSKINAAGTKTMPILMTSSSHVDANNGGIGDWGGLTINGAAPVDCPGGTCLAQGLGLGPNDGVPFGGSDANDGSGIVEYVRVEFAGREFSPDNWLRNVNLNGVGRCTVYDHVQGNVGADSCQAWFGGTVNGKFLVSSGCGNNLQATQLGYSGEIQYYLGAFFNPFEQNIGNEGLDWDGNLPTPNAPKLCNATLVGSALQSNVVGETTERCTNLHGGTEGIAANAIFEHFRDACLLVNEPLTCPPGPVDPVVEHSLLFDNGNDTGGPVQVAGSSPIPCTPAAWYVAVPAVDPINPSMNGSDPHTPIIYGTGVPNAQTDLNQFIPAGPSPGTATNPLVNSLAVDCKTLDNFFDTTDYVGAFRPGDPAANWLTAPWISFRLR
jgi:hypothetical protein